MGAKQELLERAGQEYEGLKAAIKGLDEAQMSQVWLGSWGVREILAHMAGWHREMIPALERLGRGEAPYPMILTAGMPGSWKLARDGRRRTSYERWTPPTASC